jgi:hypothetical protein
MSDRLKIYNPNSATWEYVGWGSQGVTGPTGAALATGPTGAQGTAGVFVASTITGPTSCNLVYGTGATAPTASNYNEGTLWIQYTV